MSATTVDLGRRRHYGAFYGLDPVPTDRPLLLLLGNCQAESLRLLLDPAAEPLDQPTGTAPAGPPVDRLDDPPTDLPTDSPGAHLADPHVEPRADRRGAHSAVLPGAHPARPPGDVVSVRVPPIHELTADDLPHLDALLGRADLLVAQPTRADYRGLPLGTEQVLARARPDLRTALVSSVRYAGLHPFHVVVHPPELDGVVPPVVAYHDLRAVVLAARGVTGPGDAGGRLDALLEDLLDDLPPLTADAVRAVGDDSTAELRRRQQGHGGVAVADLLDDPAVDDMRTVNHPGPRVLAGVARRVRAALGLAPLEVDPGRPLLDDVHAPVHPAVAAVRRPAAGPAPSPDHWRVGGRWVAEREVLAAQLAWYADHPAMLREALARHGRTLDHLGLAP